jgi:Tfp pilus assembly protein PilF
MLYDLALLCGEQGRIDEAVTCYTRALRSRPGHAPSHNNLGALLLRQGRYAEAEDHFAAALRLRPNYPQSRRGLQLARQGLGQGSPVGGR